MQRSDPATVASTFLDRSGFVSEGTETQSQSIIAIVLSFFSFRRTR